MQLGGCSKSSTPSGTHALQAAAGGSAADAAASTAPAAAAAAAAAAACSAALALSQQGAGPANGAQQLQPPDTAAAAFNSSAAAAVHAPGGPLAWVQVGSAPCATQQQHQPAVQTHVLIHTFLPAEADLASVLQRVAASAGSGVVLNTVQQQQQLLQQVQQEASQPAASLACVPQVTAAAPQHAGRLVSQNATLAHHISSSNSKKLQEQPWQQNLQLQHHQVEGLTNYLPFHIRQLRTIGGPLHPQQQQQEQHHRYRRRVFSMPAAFASQVQQPATTQLAAAAAAAAAAASAGVAAALAQQQATDPDVSGLAATDCSKTLCPIPPLPAVSVQQQTKQQMQQLEAPIPAARTFPAPQSITPAPPHPWQQQQLQQLQLQQLQQLLPQRTRSEYLGNPCGSSSGPTAAAASRRLSWPCMRQPALPPVRAASQVRRPFELTIAAAGQAPTYQVQQQLLHRQQAQQSQLQQQQLKQLQVRHQQELLLPASDAAEVPGPHAAALCVERTPATTESTAAFGLPMSPSKLQQLQQLQEQQQQQVNQRVSTSPSVRSVETFAFWSPTGGQQQPPQQQHPFTSVAAAASPPAYSAAAQAMTTLGCTPPTHLPAAAGVSLASPAAVTAGAASPVLADPAVGSPAAAAPVAAPAAGIPLPLRSPAIIEPWERPRRRAFSAPSPTSTAAPAASTAGLSFAALVAAGTSTPGNSPSPNQSACSPLLPARRRNSYPASPALAATRHHAAVAAEGAARAAAAATRARAAAAVAARAESLAAQRRPAASANSSAASPLLHRPPAAASPAPLLTSPSRPLALGSPQRQRVQHEVQQQHQQQQQWEETGPTSPALSPYQSQMSPLHLHSQAEVPGRQQQLGWQQQQEQQQLRKAAVSSSVASSASPAFTRLHMSQQQQQQNTPGPVSPISSPLSSPLVQQPLPPLQQQVPRFLTPSLQQERLPLQQRLLPVQQQVPPLQLPHPAASALGILQQQSQPFSSSPRELLRSASLPVASPLRQHSAAAASTHSSFAAAYGNSRQQRALTEDAFSPAAAELLLPLREPMYSEAQAEETLRLSPLQGSIITFAAETAPASHTEHQQKREQQPQPVQVAGSLMRLHSSSPSRAAADRAAAAAARARAAAQKATAACAQMQQLQLLPAGAAAAATAAAVAAETGATTAQLAAERAAIAAAADSVSPLVSPLRALASAGGGQSIPAGLQLQQQLQQQHVSQQDWTTPRDGAVTNMPQLSPRLVSPRLLSPACGAREDGSHAAQAGSSPFRGSAGTSRNMPWTQPSPQNEQQQQQPLLQKHQGPLEDQLRLREQQLLQRQRTLRQQRVELEKQLAEELYRGETSPAAGRHQQLRRSTTEDHQLLQQLRGRAAGSPATGSFGSLARAYTSASAGTEQQLSVKVQRQHSHVNRQQQQQQREQQQQERRALGLWGHSPGPSKITLSVGGPGESLSEEHVLADAVSAATREDAHPAAATLPFHARIYSPASSPSRMGGSKTPAYSPIDAISPFNLRLRQRQELLQQQRILQQQMQRQWQQLQQKPADRRPLSRGLYAASQRQPAPATPCSAPAALLRQSSLSPPTPSLVQLHNSSRLSWLAQQQQQQQMLRNSLPQLPLKPESRSTSFAEHPSELLLPPALAADTPRDMQSYFLTSVAAGLGLAESYHRTSGGESQAGLSRRQQQQQQQHPQEPQQQRWQMMQRSPSFEGPRGVTVFHSDRTGDGMEPRVPFSSLSVDMASPLIQKEQQQQQVQRQLQHAAAAAKAPYRPSGSDAATATSALRHAERAAAAATNAARRAAAAAEAAGLSPAANAARQRAARAAAAAQAALVSAQKRAASVLGYPAVSGLLQQDSAFSPGDQQLLHAGGGQHTPRAQITDAPFLPLQEAYGNNDFTTAREASGAAAAGSFQPQLTKQQDKISHASRDRQAFRGQAGSQVQQPLPPQHEAEHRQQQRHHQGRSPLARLYSAGLLEDMPRAAPEQGLLHEQEDFLRNRRQAPSSQAVRSNSNSQQGTPFQSFADVAAAAAAAAVQRRVTPLAQLTSSNNTHRANAQAPSSAVLLQQRQPRSQTAGKQLGEQHPKLQQEQRPQQPHPQQQQQHREFVGGGPQGRASLPSFAEHDLPGNLDRGQRAAEAFSSSPQCLKRSAAAAAPDVAAAASGAAAPLPICSSGSADTARTASQWNAEDSTSFKWLPSSSESLQLLGRTEGEEHTKQTQTPRNHQRQQQLLLQELRHQQQVYSAALLSPTHPVEARDRVGTWAVRKQQGAAAHGRHSDALLTPEDAALQAGGRVAAGDSNISDAAGGSSNRSSFSFENKGHKRRNPPDIPSSSPLGLISPAGSASDAAGAATGSGSRSSSNSSRSSRSSSASNTSENRRPLHVPSSLRLPSVPFSWKTCRNFLLRLQQPADTFSLDGEPYRHWQLSHVPTIGAAANPQRQQVGPL
ncbi:hypothetical protein Efla_000773 [Eimeria flavescens]